MSDNTIRVDLDYPITTPNGVVSTVTLRRAQARDMVAAQRIEPTDAARRELLLIAMLSAEKLTVEDMEALDMADTLEVQGAFQSLLVRRNARPKDAVAGAGAAGTVV